MQTLYPPTIGGQVIARDRAASRRISEALFDALEPDGIVRFFDASESPGTQTYVFLVSRDNGHRETILKLLPGSFYNFGSWRETTEGWEIWALRPWDIHMALRQTAAI